uniref:Eukaryotic translation initiation factor 4 gamma 3 n=1 Tax=Paramormyrops kingsleyae TaxID=1676925 RepID=A0A3B3SG67_9TELE
MDQYFHQMEKIVKERKTSSRIRFMLQDVIDLRLHNWVSRRVDQGPKTIEQIHKEARIEEQEEQRKVHQQLMSKDNKRRPGRVGQGGAGSAPLSSTAVELEAAEGPGPEKFLVPVEEMERRCKAIMEEFLHITDYKEAAQCVEELEQEAQLHVFVRLGVESTLERSQTTRENLGLLFFQLLQSGTLPKEQLFKGFGETLELADDMAIDIPHVWLYLAQLLSPVLQDGGLSMRQLFSELSKFLLPVGRAGILFSEILHLLCKQMSHRKVAALWRESGLSWSDFLPEGEDVQAFISKQVRQSPRALSPEEISEHLEKLLLEDGASDEQIFDWVEANMDESEMSSSPFLRALMTAVCKAAVRGESTSCRVDTSIIQRRLPVLLKYLNSDTERQLQALYALQALMVSLDQPPNLLRMFFDCLYDEDVISEDAFYKWETSKDPAEQRGKGVALKSVTAFFTWLREAEEESEDN